MHALVEGVEQLWPVQLHGGHVFRHVEEHGLQVGGASRAGHAGTLSRLRSSIEGGRPRGAAGTPPPYDVPVTPAREGNLLLRRARLPDGPGGVHVEGGRVRAGVPGDLRIEGGRIEEIAPSLEWRADEEVLDAAGRTLIPGLHDHHLHLRALGALAHSVAVGPDDVSGPEDLARALIDAPADSSGWLRAVGYHESVAGDLDRWALDAMVPGTRVRVQHRSGAMWVLSSAAVEAVGVEESDAPGIERDADGRATGRLFRMDAWLAGRLSPGPGSPLLTESSARLVSFGVIGVTEATPGATEPGIAELVDALDDGHVLPRLHLMCPADVAMPPHPLLTRGPEKVLLDDDRLPPLVTLAASVVRAHAAGVPVAFHCVTAMQLAFAVAVLDTAGAHPGDRIEHAAVVPADMVARLASLRLTAVVNPGLLLERGDAYLDEVETRELPDLLRGASLRAGGVRVAAGTDAPFGSADPWLAVAAAHRRRTRLGRGLGPGEALDQSSALGLFMGEAAQPARPRRLTAGAPGDLCILDGDALPAPAGPGGPVVVTVVAGRVVHRLD